MPLDYNEMPVTPPSALEQAIKNQKQNGMLSKRIPDVGNSGFVGSLSFVTSAPVASEVMEDVMSYAAMKFGTLNGVQLIFFEQLQNFGDEYQNDLYMTHHIRPERKPEPLQEPEPEIEE